jgi:hypothetical protein
MMGDYIRSEGRRKICQRQLRLDNNLSVLRGRVERTHKVTLILEKETYRVEQA